MLKYINTLPCSKQHSMVLDRNRELRLRQSRSDMRGHIVGAFECVPVPALILANQPLEKLIEIEHHIRVGVLLNCERRRRMLNKDGQKTSRYTLRTLSS